MAGICLRPLRRVQERKEVKEMSDEGGIAYIKLCPACADLWRSIEAEDEDDPLWAAYCSQCQPRVTVALDGETTIVSKEGADAGIAEAHERFTADIRRILLFKPRDPLD